MGTNVKAGTKTEFGKSRSERAASLEVAKHVGLFDQKNDIS